jgi:hypothetical protein
MDFPDFFIHFGKKGQSCRRVERISIKKNPEIISDIHCDVTLFPHVVVTNISELWPVIFEAQ